MKYLQFVLWTLINNQICSYIDELNSEIIGRLDFIQSQASARSLSSVEEGINGYKKKHLTTSNKHFLTSLAKFSKPKMTP